MSLVDMFRPSPNAATQVSLGDLWESAERYGSPKLEREHYGTKGCEAAIHLRSSSSMLIVRHTDSDPLAALSGAIEKARSVMAVTKGE